MRRIAMMLAAALTCLAALTGCSDISAQLSGSQSSDPLEGGETRPAAPLETESWGTVDGMLSVVVSNPAKRTLRYAVATITARDAGGVALGTSSTGAPDGTCCAVADLPPSATYGFYFDLGPDADRVAEVEMTYRDVAWGAPEESEATSTMEATAVGLSAGALGAVVIADVSTPGPAVTQAVAQAFLTGPDGEFLAVVSGRWTCFPAGGTRRIEMQLFHPVPEGTQVDAVVAYPTTDAPRNPAPSCPA